MIGTLKKIEIWVFSFQFCFQNQFSTSKSGQTENTQICVFVYFPFDHFPKSKIDSESRFEKRIPIFLFYIFLKSFDQYLKKVKQLISHCIFKKWFDRRRVFFWTKFISGKSKHRQIFQSLGGSMPEAQIKQCPLTPSPIKGLLSWYSRRRRQYEHWYISYHHAMKRLWVCWILIEMHTCA